MRTNYVTNPSIETATTGWYRTDTCVGTAAITRVAGGEVGDYALQFAYTAEETDATGTATQYCLPTAVGTAAMGDKWTVSAYVKKGAGTTSGVTVTLRIAYYNEAGAYIGQVSGADIFSSLTTSFQRFSYTGTLPADGDISRVDARLVCSSIAYGDAFDLVSDAWLLEKVDALDDYFDGSTTDTDDWDYEWAGTAHASLSTATPALYAPELVAYQSGLNIVVEWTQYGCEKPTIAETPLTFTSASSVTYSDGVIDDCELAEGQHDITFDHVKFTGYSGTNEGTWAVVRALRGGVHDIAFESCIFATLPEGVRGNAVHFWTWDADDHFYNITFHDCWFEPQPRMQIELNGFGGWWHDVTIDHCTFEPCGGEILSLCVTNDDGETSAPYAPTVDGVVRGVENVVVTNNDLQGSGATVNGFAPVYLQGIELASVWKNTVTGLGASTISRNKIGRCGSWWLNGASGGFRDMTFEDNVFDYTYNEADAGTRATQTFIQSNIACADNTFRNNTWVATDVVAAWYTLFYFVPGCDLSGNTFEGEDWTHGDGTLSTADWEFTDSDYTNCHFHISRTYAGTSPTEVQLPVAIPESCTGSGNTFDNGYTGGDGSMT